MKDYLITIQLRTMVPANSYDSAMNKALALKRRVKTALRLRDMDRRFSVHITTIEE